MKEYKINLPLFIVAQIGWWTSVFLVYNQITVGKFCPPVFTVPACYITLTIFTLIIIALFTKGVTQRLFIYIPATVGLMTSIWFSAKQATDVTPFIQHCPQFFGLPLCYPAVILFITIIVLRIRQDK